VRVEREVLLDDIFYAMDDIEEPRRAERDERTEPARRLLAAGEGIRYRAVRRSTSRELNGELVNDDGWSNISPTTPISSARTQNRRRAVDSDDDERILYTERIRTQEESEAKRLKLEEDRFSYGGSNLVSMGN